jgi:hypothetical protein
MNAFVSAKFSRLPVLLIIMLFYPKLTSRIINILYLDYVPTCDNLLANCLAYLKRGSLHSFYLRMHFSKSVRLVTKMYHYASQLA